jgi:hypothetical protein
LVPTHHHLSVSAHRLVDDPVLNAAAGCAVTDVTDERCLLGLTPTLLFPLFSVDGLKFGARISLR